MAFARRIALWEEFRGEYGNQAVAIAAAVSRRGMKEFSLEFSQEGRLGERWTQRGRNYPPPPCLRIPITVAGEEVIAEYTPEYLGSLSTDHIAFVSPHDPKKPIPMSKTGYHSHFTSREAVDAMGGPARYATELAEALVSGSERQFDAAFHGPGPEIKKAVKPTRRLDGHPKPVLGGHTAKVIQGPDASPPKQNTLFE